MLVPLLLIAIIIGSPLAIVGCVVMMLFVVWLTLRALRVGYRLDGRVLTSVHASRRATSHEIDLGRVERTGRQRRDTLVLKLRADGDSDGGDDAIVQLQMSNMSMHSAARLRSVMENEFGIDCSSWGITGTERARRDRAAGTNSGT
jgi:hypothetical protein